MRIVHIDVAGFYTEGMTYQTNQLAKYNLKAGHEVFVISSNFHWEANNLCWVPYGESDDHGVKVIRLRYLNPSKSYFRQKVRIVLGLYSALNRIQPDMIMCHCTQFLSFVDVIKYSKKHPNVRLLVDTHTNYVNSARNWFSRAILHGMIYRPLARAAVRYADHYYCTGYDEMVFARDVYGIDEKRMEYLLLGGEIYMQSEYDRIRADKRSELGVNDDQLLLVHTGKFDRAKKTAELLRAFASVPEMNARLIILGAFDESIREEIEKMIAEDPRVQFLGWKSGDAVREYLCAADVYCQPGTGSATMQNAICCNCAVIAYPYESYVKIFDKGNFIWVNDETEIQEVLEKIIRHEIDVDKLCDNSCKSASEMLDYEKLASRIIEKE